MIGRAAYENPYLFALLGISRLEVIELMSKYNISPFDDSMSLEEFQQEVT